MRAPAMVAVMISLLPVSLNAQESVCLKSGFCLEAESHMISEGMLVVQNVTGTLQFPLDQVEGITALPLRVKQAVPSTQLVSSTDATSSREILIRAALQMGLEPEFVRSVAMVESGLQRNVVSPKGAVGLMQLMPRTAGELGVDPWRVEQNALGGAAFLRQLLIKYKGDSALALAAYNAGPGAVDKYKGVPPYAETRRYVVKVLAEYSRQQKIQTDKNLQAERARQVAAGNPAAEALRAQTTKPNVSASSPVQR